MNDDSILGIDDRIFDRIIYSPVCTTCAHRADERRKCAAFEHIPDEIWNGENHHTSPYPGDHGIQYEALKLNG